MDKQQDNNKQESEVIEKDELKLCRSQSEEYLNGWKRAKADLVNFQKDESKRLEEIVQFGSKALMKELIVVLDSFDLALGSMSEKAEKGLALSLSKGVYMIRAQLEDVMKKYGLERMVVEVGKPIDHRLHEAILAIESEELVDTIIEEVEHGYLLYGRVLRPARVKVAKEKQQQ